MSIAAEIVRKPRRGATGTFMVASVVFLTAAVPLGALYALWSHKQGMKDAWTIRGPACPAATHSWKEIALHRDPHRFSYGGATFGYLFGAADCASIPQHGAFDRKPDFVCQFTEPTRLSVTVGGRTQELEPGYRRPATVTLHDGQTACVLGGWFRE
ncbi:hypothetical protein [Phenylobacterium sp.]|uniref:hypothetical protein n=1 Tax=Phenylobacterium sp. TaxID=1871053 RepID=UPI001207ECA7|nr:hypothetical protein [Phenylobacterium sp.]THD61078.1 MAG: hypothetical protein E8A49_12500 [Phenylobacterium sp.]